MITTQAKAKMLHEVYNFTGSISDKEKEMLEAALKNHGVRQCFSTILTGLKDQISILLLKTDYSKPENVYLASNLQGRMQGAVTFVESLYTMVELREEPEEEEVS